MINKKILPKNISVKSPLKASSNARRNNCQSARYFKSTSRDRSEHNDQHIRSRSQSLIENKDNRALKHAVFCPASYGYNSLNNVEPGGHHLVVAAKAEGQKTIKELTKSLVTRANVTDFIYQNPDSTLFHFDQVLNDNSIPGTAGPKVIRTRSKSRLSSTHSRDSSKKFEFNQMKYPKTNFYSTSLIKDKLIKTLEYGMGSTTDRPMVSNFCYVQVNTHAVEAKGKESFQQSLQRRTTMKSQNFGRFLSTKSMDEGTNVAFLAVKDILGF